GAWLCSWSIHHRHDAGDAAQSDLRDFCNRSQRVISNREPISPTGRQFGGYNSWLVAQGSVTAAGSGEEVVPASDYRALQNQVRELHRLLGKKTLEAEILKEALEHATGSKKQLRLPPSPPKDGSR